MDGHICSQNTLVFALVFCFGLRACVAHASCFCHLVVKNPWSLSDAEPSVRLYVVKLFSNQKGSLSFHPIFRYLDIWLQRVQQNYPKSCAIWILIFFLLIFKWLLNYKNRWKFGILEVFVHFPQKSLTWDHESWFTSILWVLSCVKNGPCGPNCRALFGPEQVAKIGHKQRFIEINRWYKNERQMPTWSSLYLCLETSTKVSDEPLT